MASFRIYGFDACTLLSCFPFLPTVRPPHTKQGCRDDNETSADFLTSLVGILKMVWLLSFSSLSGSFGELHAMRDTLVCILVCVRNLSQCLWICEVNVGIQRYAVIVTLPSSHDGCIKPQIGTNLAPYTHTARTHTYIIIHLNATHAGS